MILGVIDLDGSLVTFPMNDVVVAAAVEGLFLMARSVPKTTPFQVFSAPEAAVAIRDLIIAEIDEALNTGRSPRVIDLRRVVDALAAEPENA